MGDKMILARCRALIVSFLNPALPDGLLSRTLFFFHPDNGVNPLASLRKFDEEA